MNENDSPMKPFRRRWLSYGLRGLLALILVCSLPLAWFSRDFVRSQRETAVAERIRAAGGRVDYDYEEDPVCFMGAPVALDPPGPKWVRDLLGQNIYASITVVDLQGVDDVRPLLPLLPQLSQLHHLYLPDVSLSPASVEPLRQLEQLKSCNLRFTQCTPEELGQLAKWDGIGELTLEESAATDEMLAVLPSLGRLPKLTLCRSNMTNAGLAHLGEIDSLEELTINNNGIKHLVKPSKLHTLTLLSTYVTEGCMDSLAKMKSLTTLAIEPGELDLQYYPWGCIRMDNYESVDAWSLRQYEEDEPWVQCIHVDEEEIFFDEYDRLSLQTRK